MMLGDPAGDSARARWSGRAGIVDLSVCFILFAGTIAYLSRWAHDFYGFDEGLYLYEAKRVSEGAVMYRDFFEIVTPGFYYYMAAVFAVLGASFEAARLAMAIVHGLIGALLYAICREARVAVPLALLPAVAHLTLGYPTVPISSAHWAGTLAMVFLLFVVLRRPAGSALRALVWGACAGAVVLIEQHRGAVVAAGTPLAIVVDAWIAPGGGDSSVARWRARARTAVQRCVAYAAGVLAIVAPVIGGFVLAAGVQQVMRALVWYPLINYRRIHHDAQLWRDYLASLIGQHDWINHYLAELVPLPFVFQYLPLAMPIAGIVAARDWFRQRDLAALRPLLILLLFSILAFASVAYNLDHIHFAYAAPIWCALAAALIDRMLRAVHRAVPRSRPLTAAVIVLLLIGAVWQLRQSLLTRERWFPVPMQTPFGRIDQGWQSSIDEIRCLEQWVRDEGAQEMFVFPAYPGLYLLTGVPNATRYQIALPNYTDREEIDEIIATLEARRVPIVVQNYYVGSKGLEALNQYLQDHYEWVGPPVPAGGVPVMKVYRRWPESYGVPPTLTKAIRRESYLRRKMPCPRSPASDSGS